ncbi:ABC-type glycerol-3-phosphate transport system substrate-binding protein [Paraburkholderia youngii]|uniref:Multiple sugar transport system substrate-binding protein/raffinose/stachyose/melibiose transport system substrate-binding protein n=1 Tax=Paraburkholderia youngii TaxID=2782701 RepID=A0A7W8P7N1_9BURK|nr:extracellular solute-binding protein [Paraburkholderia youngii]MBB5403022.1 multiple sugar transport system substrate-binding protein/raffinose/stachyose/melibiose transport system substrate-binding protein [Paraburkholderia youngii]
MLGRHGVKRRALVLAALLASAAGFTTPAFADSGEVSISDYFTGDMGEKAFNEQLAKFTTATGIAIKQSPVGHEDFKSVILVRAAGHSLPDVFSFWAGAKTQFIADSKSLHPIDGMWKSAGLDSVISRPIAAAATSYSGHRYLVPVDYHFVGVFYNPKVMAKAGITTMPTTWDGFLAMCKQLKSQGITPIAMGSKNRWPAQFWFDYMLLRTAGPEYRAKLMTGHARYDDPQVSSVMDQWKSMFDAGYFNNNANAIDWTDAADKVAKGDAAMTLMGTWITGYWNNNHLVAGKDYDVAVFPQMQAGVPNVALGPVDGLVISANAKNVAGSEKLLDYMISNTDVQSAWTSSQGALSANVKVDQSHYSPVMQKAAAAVEKSNGFAFNYDLATPPPVSEVGLSMFAKFIDQPGDIKSLLTQTQTDAQTAFKKQ